MSNEAQISFTGTAGADAEIRFTQSGVGVANVSVAVTPRVKDGNEWKDGDTTWYRVSAWGSTGSSQFPENVSESIRKGDRIAVTGRLIPREWEKDGVTRLSLDVAAESVALDLRFRGARSAERTQRSTPDPRGGAARGGQPDPWATPAVKAPTAGGWGTDEPPF